MCRDLLFEPGSDIRENFLTVLLEQKLVPCAGIEGALDVLHPCVLQALDSALDTLALLADWVGITGEKEQRKLFGDLCE